MAAAGVIWVTVPYLWARTRWVRDRMQGVSFGGWQSPLEREKRHYTGQITREWCFPCYWDADKLNYDFRVPDTRTEIDWRNG